MPKQRTVQFPGNCPYCKKKITMAVPTDIVASDPIDLAPIVACDQLRPVGSIFVYKISSEQIKEFLLDKVRQYSPNAQIDLAPKYCEKKKRKDNEPHHSYASFRVAFSEDIVKHAGEGGWFETLGETGGSITYVDTHLEELIKRYRYKRRDVEQWLKSYKNMEDLENAFGMTEAYINDIRNFATPQRVKTTDGKDWVIFAASPLPIIRDMLADGETHLPTGRIVIKDTYPVSREVVEFIVHVHPKEIEMKENRYVRQILTGDEKLKK